MTRVLRDQQGFTLLETIIALGIFAIVMVTTAGVLIAAQTQSRFADTWGDRTQQLRVALHQLGEDITYSQEGTLSPRIEAGVPTGIAGHVEIEGYQLRKLTQTNQNWHSDWRLPEWLPEDKNLADNNVEGWPAPFHQVVPVVLIRYEISQGQLIRRVLIFNSATNKYDTEISKQTLVTDLVDFDLTDGSYFEVTTEDDPADPQITNKRVSVYIRSRTGGTGGMAIVETKAQWHVR